MTAFGKPDCPLRVESGRSRLTPSPQLSKLQPWVVKLLPQLRASGRDGRGTRKRQAALRHLAQIEDVVAAIQDCHRAG